MPFKTGLMIFVNNNLLKSKMMFGIGTQEIIFIVLIVLLFFGGKKIPELMKGLGKGVCSFKEGVKGVENDLDIKDDNPVK